MEGAGSASPGAAAAPTAPLGSVTAVVNPVGGDWCWSPKATTCRPREIALIASYLGQGPNARPRHEVRATFRLGPA